MKTTRTWAAIIIATVAALITPTQDAMTLALLAVPMYGLYELCIWLSWWMDKKDRKLYPEYYKDEDEAKSVEVADDWDNENYNPWNEDGSSDEDDTDTTSKPAAKTSSTPAETPSPAEGPHPPSPSSGSSSPAEAPPAAEASPSESTESESSLDPSDENPDGEKRNTD